MNRVGLHIRFADDIVGLLKKALVLEIPFFQFFLIQQYTGKYIEVSENAQREFLALRHEHFKQLYIHGSYWLNGGLGSRESYTALKKELCISKQLDATHFILHPGCAHKQAPKQEGFDNLVRFINYAMRIAPDITIVLENSAHGKRVIGGALEDFGQILSKINRPENLKFCLDTAHAHAFGYALSTEQEQEAFIQELAFYWGIDRLALMHLNDTSEELGSGIDRHDIIGNGKIGLDALMALGNHRLLKNLPIIMEPPLLNDQEEQFLVQRVRSFLV